MIYNNLGDFYIADAEQQKEAEGCYLKALEIYKVLAIVQPSIYESYLARICNNLGNFYTANAEQRKDDAEWWEEAEEYYLRALVFYEHWALVQPSVYKPNLAMIYNNLQILYRKANRRKEAEMCHQEVLEIDRCLVSMRLSVCGPGFATVYKNYKNSYSDELERFEEMEVCSQNALEAGEMLATKHLDFESTASGEQRITLWNLLGKICPEMMDRRAHQDAEDFGPNTTLFYGIYHEILERDKRVIDMAHIDLESFYNGEVERRKEAETRYLDVLEYKTRYAAVFPFEVVPQLARICNNLGNFYLADVERRKEAEACLQKALEIWMRLAASQPSAYELDLAEVYNNLGLLYSANVERWKEAEDCYLQALEIRKRLAASQPSVNKSNLARTYNNLGRFYSADLKGRREADACFQKALAIYKRLTAAEPSVYEPYLAMIYFNLGELYSQDTDQSEQAEGYYKQAVVIAQKYFRTNFYCAQIYDKLKKHFC